jgi:hypothetical protein
VSERFWRTHAPAEQLRRLRKLPKAKGLILQRETEYGGEMPNGWRLVMREPELFGGAMTLKDIER